MPALVTNGEVSQVPQVEQKQIEDRNMIYSDRHRYASSLIYVLCHKIEQFRHTLNGVTHFDV